MSNSHLEFQPEKKNKIYAPSKNTDQLNNKWQQFYCAIHLKF